MKIAGPGDFEILAGHVAVEAGGGERSRIRSARLHVDDNGTWTARVSLEDHGPASDDVEIHFTGDLCAWSGRGHVVSHNEAGELELAGDEPLTVLPAVGA